MNEPTKHEDLKRCPFCGGEAVLRLLPEKTTPATESYFIQCTSCLASSMKITVTKEQREHVSEIDRTIEISANNVIDAWNRRAAE